MQRTNLAYFAQQRRVLLKLFEQSMYAILEIELREYKNIRL